LAIGGAATTATSEVELAVGGGQVVEPVDRQRVDGRGRHGCVGGNRVGYSRGGASGGRMSLRGKVVLCGVASDGWFAQVGSRSLQVKIARLSRQRSGPITVVKSTSVFACFEPLGGPCSCSMKQNSCAKNRSIPLDRLSEAIPCEVLAILSLREQDSFLTPHISPASRAIDASPSLSLSGRGKCIRLMLCLSFYQWRCIYPGEQIILAPFLEKTSLDRAPGRFADNLFARKHAKTTCS